MSLKLEKKDKKQKPRKLIMQIQMYDKSPEREDMVKRFRKMCDELGYTMNHATLIALKAMIEENGY